MNISSKKINPLRRFKKSSIILQILYHASKKPIYGSWIKKELERHGYHISDGNLYPWLNRLTYSGLLSLEKKNVRGKIRKYYSITEEGKNHFEKIKEYLKELYDEVIKGI